MKIPAYRLHRGSGQAVVTLSGETTYLGRWGSPGSREKYHQLVGEWIARGRKSARPEAGGLTIAALISRYLEHAGSYYVKDGRPTSQLSKIRIALRVLGDHYGSEPVAAFGPTKLKAVRDAFVAAGWVRDTVNTGTDIVRAMFRWSVASELVSASVWEGLKAVQGLRKGRTSAPDRPPVKGVPDADIEAVARVALPSLAAMIRLQRLTAMRPGEVCSLRPRDIDRSGPVWRYSPADHKTIHHGKGRVVLIGPRAREILAPILPSDPNQLVFLSPHGLPWRADTYCKSIEHTCIKAGVPKWTPNQLRHSAATAIRAAFGLEATQAVLGHARADVTQIYAERDLAKAMEVIGRIG